MFNAVQVTGDDGNWAEQEGDEMLKYTEMLHETRVSTTKVTSKAKGGPKKLHINPLCQTPAFVRAGTISHCLVH